MKGSRKPPPDAIERGPEVCAFGIDGGRIEIAHGADRFRLLEVADRLAARLLLLEHPQEHRIAERVAPLTPLPAAAEAAHPPLNVEKKALALLLAIVADVDPGLDLLGTTQSSAARPAASIAAPSTGSPAARRTYSRTSSGGRGRLPA